MGDYACREPFQLLTANLIPSQVFDLYEKEFIPFHWNLNTSEQEL